MSRLEQSFLNGYVPYVLRQADQTLSAPFYEALNQFGVARSEWRVLAVLHDSPELSVVELATKALSPQPTVTHAVSRLEKRRLVKRSAGSTDKRQRIVSLTATGIKLTTQLIGEAQRLEADLLADAGDLTELMNALTDLTEAVRTRTALIATEMPHAG